MKLIQKENEIELAEKIKEKEEKEQIKKEWMNKYKFKWLNKVSLSFIIIQICLQVAARCTYAFTHQMCIFVIFISILLIYTPVSYKSTCNYAMLYRNRKKYHVNFWCEEKTNIVPSYCI